MDMSMMMMSGFGSGDAYADPGYADAGGYDAAGYDAGDPESGTMGKPGTQVEGSAGGGMGGSLQFASGLFQGIAGMQDAEAQAKAKQFEAEQLRQRAAEERASAQRRAFDRRLAVNRLISKQVAIGAASGAGVTTPSLLDVIGDTAQEGEYHALGDMFVGESRARGAIDQANAALYQAKVAKMRGRNALLGGVLQGFGGSMRSRGGSGGSSFGFSSYYG